MSSEKLFNKTKLATKDVNVTAVDISGRNLITGESNGTLTVYEIKQKQFLTISKARPYSTPFSSIKILSNSTKAKVG